MKYKHGTKQRKIWRKLHIGVNDDGNIIAGEVTTLRDSDIRTIRVKLSLYDTVFQALKCRYSFLSIPIFNSKFFPNIY